MQDILGLTSQLPESDRLFQDSIKRFMTNTCLPDINKHFEAATFPKSWVKDLASLGAFGINLPESYGGANASKLCYGLMCEALEACDSAIRSFVSVQNSLVIYPIFTYGSEHQKATYLPKLCQGEMIGCFGLTEPDVGSNPQEMKTTAKKTKDGWLLNGSKMWITNASIADVVVVWAKTQDGVRGFLLEKGLEGFSSKTIESKMSLRASSTGELIFENVKLPDSALLPGSEKGIAAPLSCLSQARLGICWGAIGAGMACFDIATGYTQERKQFGKPIASFQLVQAELAEMFSQLTLARNFNIQMTKKIDAEGVDHALISMGKRLAARTALDCARRARNLLGGNGISLEYHVIRHLLNLETVFTYEGTDHIHSLILGKAITGLDALS